MVYQNEGVDIEEEKTFNTYIRLVRPYEPILYGEFKKHIRSGHVCGKGLRKRMWW
jgi:hypothetical protein